MEEKHAVLTTTVGEDEIMDKVRRNCGDAERFDAYRALYRGLLEDPYEGIPAYPIQLDMELNGTCNYRCPSCNYRIDKNTDRPEMSFAKYREIILDGVGRGLMAVRLNYHNEPLVKRDLCDYVRFAKANGVADVFLSTNGSLLDGEMAESLIGAGLDRLQVSIDAVSAEAYERIRPGGDYRKVVGNVKRFMLIRNGMGRELPTVRVNFVRMPGNGGEMERFKEYWLKAGVDGIGIQDYIDWEGNSTDRYDEEPYRCLFPFRMLVVRYNGDVLPCCLFESVRLVVGNIYKQDISQIWASGKLKRLRELCGQDHGWRENGVCRRCVRSIFSGKEECGNG